MNPTRRVAYGCAAAALLASVLSVGAAGASPGTNGSIAFGAGASLAGSEIYTIQPDGTGLMRLTNNTVFDAGPSVSPDGTRIAFRRDVDNRGRLFVMAANGSGQKQLSGTTAGFDAQPTWSPDGKRIAIVSSRNGVAQLFVMNADGTGTRQLTAETSTVSYPAWAPKGEGIAFVRSGDIFVRTDAGTTRLTATPGFEIEPKWSPDGGRLAFLSNRDQTPDESGSGYELFTMNANGSNVQRLTQAPTDFGHATWAPDGTTIAFTRIVAGGGLVLFMIPAGGGAPRQVAGKLPQLPETLDWAPRPTAATPPITSPPAKADLAVTVAGGEVKPAARGLLTSYDLMVKNLGPGVATNLRLAVQPAGDAELYGTKPGPWRCSSTKAGGKWSLSCTLPQLAAGTTAPLTVTGQSRSGSPMRAAANVFAAGPDPVSGNNGVVLGPGADLVVTISRPSSGRVGKRVDFTVTVTNLSPTPSGPFGVYATITDNRPGPLPDFVVGTLKDISAWPPSSACGPGYRVCSAGLGPKKRASFRLDATAKTRRTFTAVASVRSFGSVLPDPTPANNAARATVPVQ